MTLSNKIIVITGGAKGLGFAMTKLLVEKGARVVISGTDEAKLNQVADELKVTTFKGDVTNELEVNDLAQFTVSKFGRIDMWINNAGIWMPPESLEEMSLDKAQKLFQTNFFGYMHGMRAAISQMKTQNQGTIVNIISTTAFDGMNGSSSSIYVASKYALRGLTNVVREEVRESNITVIGAYPGGFKTELFHEAVPKNFDQFMSPEEVAEKIIANLESDTPETQLVLKRPGQVISHEIK